MTEMAKALPSGSKKEVKNAKIKNEVVLEKARIYDCNRKNPCCQKRPQETVTPQI